jgi:hypothetical protein
MSHLKTKLLNFTVNTTNLIFIIILRIIIYYESNVSVQTGKHTNSEQIGISTFVTPLKFQYVAGGKKDLTNYSTCLTSKIFY